MCIFAKNWPFIVVVNAVLSTMTVQEHQGNDKSCVWHAADFSDGELKDETFAIRFASVESKFILSKYLLYLTFEMNWKHDFLVALFSL